MSNRRCAAKTCFNTQGCRPNLKFFNFPKDEDTCYQWIVNSDREDLLDKPIEQLSKCMLCADHFEAHWFLNPKYKTAFIRTGHPIPTIFYNNLADFVPKSLQKSFAEKNRNHADEKMEFYRNMDIRNAKQNSVQRSTEDLLDILRDGETSDSSQLLLTDSDDYTVEIKIDLDPGIEDFSAIKGCHKICRLCARLVYEFKLISLFSIDSSQDLANKINRLLPEKISEGDGLPEHVCNSCVSKLNECDSAVQSFIAADQKLRNLYRLQNLLKTDDQAPEKNDENEHTVGLPITTENPEFPLGLTEFVAIKDEGSSYSLEDESREDSSMKCDDDYVIKKSNHISQNEVAKNTNFEEFEEETLEVLPEQTLEVRSDGLEDSCDSSNPTNVDIDTTQELNPIHVKADDSWSINTEDSSTCDTSQDTKAYQCSLCKMVFSERNKLLYHEISEHIFEEKDEKDDVPSLQKKYKREQVTCRDCGQVFSGKKPLRRHVRDHHIPAENICEFCGAHYQIKSQLEVHRRLHTNEKPFTCETCNINFHFKKELQRHKRNNHSHTRSLTCSVCNKVCPNRNAVWRHEKTHTDERNVLCYLCGKVLSNPQSMRVHMRTHSSDRPCSCPTCGKSFKDNTSVSKHMLMHSTTKNFACDICGRAFYSKALVKQHKLSHSGVKPHKCDICGAAYNRLGNLNQHKKKHASSPRPVENLSHECVVCGKRMRSDLTLKYHLAKHTGEKKPFDCEVCGKRFVAVDPYRVHMRIHTGERPYQCTTCGKTFRSSFTLKQHAALHRDECPYPCPYCERKFKRLQSLIVHKRTHTGEKPHRCPLCGRAFAQKGDMMKHTKTHNRDRPATANKIKEDGVVMEIEHIPDLALSDSEITSEFLIDMPIVEVETEIQSEIPSDIHSQIPAEINSEIS